MLQSSNEIRGVMIPVTNGRVLLPNATVAEVITYAAPERLPSAPDWVLGRVAWRGWRVPLFSFSMLAGLAAEEGYINVKVAILKALGARPKMPFLAMLTQGFPRLTTITPEILVPSGDDSVLPSGVRSTLTVRDDSAVIPDLDRIEEMVAEALATS